ncbi:hypothetical protein ABZ918_33400 [Streptomyces viridosporus]|uniref:Mu transposase domain-containing protein n=1 Tax=Streptomyces viridosporus TaxID=67581 RepID=UPI0034143060
MQGYQRVHPEHPSESANLRRFGIESFYCRPGIEGAHEKGGVEGQIGYFRRNHFTPVPEVASLAELNELVEQWDQHDGLRRIGSRPRTIDEYFDVERPLLLPLPEEPFETRRLFTPRVDRYGQIPVRTNRYSVPIRLIGKRVRGAAQEAAHWARPRGTIPAGAGSSRTSPGVVTLLGA